MYQGASTGNDPSAVTSSAVEDPGKALEHMLAALKILDANNLPPAIGARLDETIEMLREELAKRTPA